MRYLMLSLLLVSSSFAGCALDAEEPEEGLAFGGGNVPGPGPDDVEEGVYFDDDQCHLVYRNVSSPDADFFFIWNLGVDGVVEGVPYPTSARADLYVVVAPAPANAIHHVDGQDQYDHYHIVDAAPGDDDDDDDDDDGDDNRYDGTWDVFVVFPGPNFNPATYKAARSVNKMKKQIQAGILGPILTTPEAGFDPLVLNLEIHDECD
jgi:hypothetical protein